MSVTILSLPILSAAIAVANDTPEILLATTTGVTGPAAGRSGLPIGTFWVGLSVKDGEDTAVEVHIDGDRDATKHGAAQAAFDLLGTVL